jgi:hypothetical protein
MTRGKRKTLDGWLIPDTRKEFDFEIELDGVIRSAYTLAESAEEARKSMAKVAEECGWKLVTKS